MSAKSKIDDVKRHIDYAIRSLRYVQAESQTEHYVRNAIRDLEDAQRDLANARSKVSQLMQS
jgi:hypothetical protein